MDVNIIFKWALGFFLQFKCYLLQNAMLEWHCTKFVPLYLVLELILKRGELQGCKKIDALLWDLRHLNFRRHYRQISRALMPIPFFWDVVWLQYEIGSCHWLQIIQANTHWRNFLNNFSVELLQGFKIKSVSDCELGQRYIFWDCREN